MDNVDKNMSEALLSMQKALFFYENNGARYEPADREDLINIILEIGELRKRLTLFMAQLPYLDHHSVLHAYYLLRKNKLN